MIDDRIERETLIAASPERVWPLVAEPGFWVAEEGTVSGTVAREGETVLAKHPEYGEFPVRVEKVQAPTYIAYRWASAFPGQELKEGNSTLIEFTLTEEAGGTRLRVVESGFSALDASEEIAGRALRDNTDGWPQVLDAFRVRAEQSAV
jgi:uncharacterized protein YndB with AHSA1/START domain